MSALVAGCVVGEDPPPPKAVGGQIGSFQSACLSGLPQGVRDYFAGALQVDEKIGALWDCGASALTEFKLLVRGTQPDVISSRDLVTFLNGYLKDSDKVSDELRVQAMKLKAALLGGDAENLTSREFDQTIELFRILKRGTIAVKLLMPLDINHIASFSEAILEGQIGALQGAAKDIGAYVQNTGKDYAFDDISRLLVEFERIYLKSYGPQNGFRWLREQLPVLKIFKSVVVGGSQDQIGRAEWLNGFVLAAKAYGTYLLYSNENSRHGADWFTPAGFDALEKVLGRAVDHLVEVGGSHDSGVVPAPLVANLVQTLTRMKTQPDPGFASMTTTVSLADVTAKLLLGKQAVFGGEAGAVDLSRAERLHPFLAAVKSPGLTLYQILKRTDLDQLSEEEFEKVLAQFDSAVASFVDALQVLRHDEGTESFATFFSMLVAVGPLFELDTSRQAVDDALRVLRGSKPALLGPPYDTIGPDEWRPLLEQGARLAHIYLLTKRKPPQPAGGGVSREQLDYLWALSDAGLTLIDAALQNHQNQPLILTSELTELLDGLPSSFDKKQALLALLPEIMSLKQTVFGGGDQGWTHDELQNLRRFLLAVKRETYALRVYFPLDFSQIASWSQARVDELAFAFESAAQHLADALPISGVAAYPLGQLDALFRKIEPLVQDTNLIEKVREALPALNGLKGIALRPPQNVLAPGELPELLRTLGGWGGIGLRFYHYIKQSPEWNQGVGLARGLELAGGLLQSLRASAVKHEGSTIRFEDFDQLLDAAYDLAAKHDVSIPLRLATAKAFLRPSARRLLGGSNTGSDGRQAAGITPFMIDLTRARLDEWAHGQILLESVFSGLGGGPDALKTDGYEKTILQKAIGSHPDSKSTLELLQTFRPLFLGQEGHFSFLYDNSRERLYSFNDLSRKNLYRLMVRALIEGYAEDPARAAVGRQLTQAELQIFVVDVHDMISDFRFGPQDEPDPKLAAKRFLEANVFTSQSNGDPYFDLYEGVEYVGFLGSTKNIAAPIFADALSNCPHSGTDVYGRPSVAIPCFRERFFDKFLFNENFANVFPMMASMFAGLDGPGKSQFMQNLEIAARKGKYNDDPISSFEAEDFVMVMSYIESLFKRFDVERNGQLKMREALGAFPIVCSKLKEISKLPGTCKPRWGLLEALFGHLLVFGTVPKKAGPSLGDKIKVGLEFLGWTLRWATIRHCTHCSYRVDRQRILSVIEALATNGSSSTIDVAGPGWGDAHD